MVDGLRRALLACDPCEAPHILTDTVCNDVIVRAGTGARL